MSVARTNAQTGVRVPPRTAVSSELSASHPGLSSTARGGSARPVREDVLVIGAGPAGLSAAITLARAGRRPKVIEKSDRVGGLAKTYTFREDCGVFRTDHGPHRFYSQNSFIYEFVADLLNDKWISVDRQTRQFIDGRYYDYPVNPIEALRNLGVKRTACVLRDYLSAQLSYTIGGRPIETFEDHLVSTFGRSLAELGMLNYTRKIWGVEASRIHPEWGRQRVGGLDLRKIMVRMVENLVPGRASSSPQSLIDAFYYPSRGAGLVYDTIAERLRDLGSPVQTGTRPTRIRHEGRRIQEITLEGERQTSTIAPDVVIQSVPPRVFLSLLDPAPPSAVLDAVARLRYRDHRCLFITLDRPSVTRDQWLYFPESRFPFGRISEMRNFSREMSPAGKTSLLIEFFCSRGDAVWKRSPQELLDLAMPHLESIGLISRADVRRCYTMEAAHAYPVYDLTYKENVTIVMEYLSQFENLQTIGRPGLFRYTNQDHSIEMGMLAAKKVLGSAAVSLTGTCGENRDYFEEGVHPASLSR